MSSGDFPGASSRFIPAAPVALDTQNKSMSNKNNYPKSPDGRDGWMGAPLASGRRLGATSGHRTPDERKRRTLVIHFHLSRASYEHDGLMSAVCRCSMRTEETAGDIMKPLGPRDTRQSPSGSGQFGVWRQGKPDGWTQRPRRGQQWLSSLLITVAGWEVFGERDEWVCMCIEHYMKHHAPKSGTEGVLFRGHIPPVGSASENYGLNAARVLLDVQYRDRPQGAPPAQGWCSVLHGLLSLARECIIQLTFVFQLSRRASLNFTLKFFSASSSDLPKAKESF
ncbi:hypothetical protein EYF80_002012 [Liparis tanakae]|uniref:Uncharacterized protein n=1 Tax=Liparis tanakae TaxID=230148 RepID=A0A4Z2JBG6_9TELE|nr:hypothetical protein EYF80_002012 [Liparis tanakae]